MALALNIVLLLVYYSEELSHYHGEQEIISANDIPLEEFQDGREEKERSEREQREREEGKEREREREGHEAITITEREGANENSSPATFIPSQLSDLYFWRYESRSEQTASLNWTISVILIVLMAFFFFLGMNVSAVTFVTSSFLMAIQSLLIRHDPIPHLLNVDYKYSSPCLFSSLFFLISFLLK